MGVQRERIMVFMKTVECFERLDKDDQGKNVQLDIYIRKLFKFLDRG